MWKMKESPSSCCCWPRVSGRGSSIVVLWRADSSGVVIVSIPHCSTAALHTFYSCWNPLNVFMQLFRPQSGPRVFNLSWGEANLYLVCCISVQTLVQTLLTGMIPEVISFIWNAWCEDTLSRKHQPWLNVSKLLETDLSSSRECCKKCHRSLQSEYV